MPESVQVSCGSAAVLGLEPIQMETAPTTAYLMLGGRCAYDCAFCAQARGSTARADQLSRVTWPAHRTAEVVEGLAAAYARGAIQRCCLQVTAGPRYSEQAREVVRAVRGRTDVPLCVSIRATDTALFSELLALGAERVTLAIDAACERVYSQVKGRGWQRALALLLEAARSYPGHVGTHLIVGLGETEAEAAGFLQRMHDAGVLTALFAFTPIVGTALAGAAPPMLESYRRLQAARYSIVSGRARAERFGYSPEGRITSYGIGRAALVELLRGGEAFRTSGCPGCNRPYYNERPGGPLFNYPRPLRPEEADAALAAVLAGLDEA